MGEHRFTARGEELLRHGRNRGDDRQRDRLQDQDPARDPDQDAFGPPEHPMTAPGEPPREPAAARTADRSAAAAPRPDHTDHPDRTDHPDHPDRTPAGGPTTPSAAGARPVPADGEQHLLPDSSADRFQSRWQDILAGFVDGPKHAVEEADQLLDQVATLITDGLAERRRALRDGWQGDGWQGDGDTRTEELRVTLQQYRGLVTHLLKT
ncbi:hypothetical protein ACIQGZ_15975 [Streptomyces sp. NPDC092296]|uniref:hypothetical protein n=1 Tax=Streptomyces sp. NPDC092296 TaxID=3366012 RepID=UPI0037F3DE9A